jgi:hypothetical protein
MPRITGRQVIGALSELGWIVVVRRDLTRSSSTQAAVAG